ncbi:hypothetical protein BKA67DRAFT_576796 [Truncatella angustata]|uniref:BHLH domain-containing protein n=1 Tax=Truncatella angustata TaxID=152316 RepID=A0A9P8UFU6_9PEZI|nr:uncharacterized protein BKA67DRAFT_576796 [Truncatella angustata]KAH6649105.1 hypothetical protein BKA67DRAFT_576796 [Truncatella angustata]
MFESAVTHETERSPILNHTADYFCNVDGVALESAADFGTVQMPSQLLDCDFSALDGYPSNPAATQWPMLSPLSMLHSTESSTHSNMLAEVVPEASLRSGTSRSNEPNIQKGNQPRKQNGSQRRHYAVEKRYRSTLDSKYAALARTLSSEAAQRICRTDSQEWTVQLDRPPYSGPNDEPATTGSRQRKTATLSVTIETINILTRCCRREAMKLKQLQCDVQDMRNRMQQMIKANAPVSREQPQKQQDQQQEQQHEQQQEQQHSGV